MNVALWIMQGILSVVFLVSGVCKLTWSRQRLIDNGQTGVQLFPMPMVRFTAICELLGAVGVVVPMVVHRFQWLTPTAAAGLAAVMIGATYAHIRLREPANVAITVTIFVIAVLVALGRSVV